MIKSNKKLQFSATQKGFIEIKINIQTNKIDKKEYQFELIDICTDDEGVELGRAVRYPPIPLSYEKLNQIASISGVDMGDMSKTTDNINEIIKKGLFIQTQMECQNGLTGEGTGIYFSKATDWAIVE